MARAKTPEATTGPGSCVAVMTVYAGSAPGANTNISFTDASGASVTTFKVPEDATALRVTVSLATSSVLDLRVTDGSTAYTQHLNGGVALAAGTLYTFTVGARRYSTQSGTTELSYAFRVVTDSVIQTLFVEAVSGPVV